MRYVVGYSANARGHDAVNLAVSLARGRGASLDLVLVVPEVQQFGAAHAPKRKNLGEKFALRGFVTCGDCGKPLRSCDSTSGTGRRYAYYLCHTKTCTSYGKSIPRDQIEGDFEELLKKMHPSEGLLGIVKAMFADAWDQRAKQQGAIKQTMVREVARLDRQIDSFLDKLADTASPHAIRAYERKIETLEREKLMAQSKLAEIAAPRDSAPKKLELALEFLKKPYKLWASGNMEHRRLVLKLAFADRIQYDRFEGARTPQIALSFRALEKITDHNVCFGAVEKTR